MPKNTQHWKIISKSFFFFFIDPTTNYSYLDFLGSKWINKIQATKNKTKQYYRFTDDYLHKYI